MNDVIQTQSTARPNLSVVKAGQHLKILEVTGSSGMSMPMHYCTTDAVILVESGASELLIDPSPLILRKGDNFLIPSGVPHQLRILEAFKAKVIMSAGAEITFCKADNER